MLRLLVVADEACAAAALCRALAERSAGRRTELLVVAPALVSGFRYLDSDVDGARAVAQVRLDETVAALGTADLSARGEIGSESPLEAIADALAVFPADEILVATPPPERTNWLEQGVVERARELHEAPVTHLVVDGDPPGAAPGSTSRSQPPLQPRVGTASDSTYAPGIGTWLVAAARTRFRRTEGGGAAPPPSVLPGTQACGN